MKIRTLFLKIKNPKIWMPTFILILGLGFVFYFIKNKPQARKKSNFSKGTLVETIEAINLNTQINLNTHGKVRPSKKVIVTARINGSVNWIRPLLSEGQFFKDGDLLLTIDA